MIDENQSFFALQTYFSLIILNKGKQEKIKCDLETMLSFNEVLQTLLCSRTGRAKVPDPPYVSLIYLHREYLILKILFLLSSGLLLFAKDKFRISALWSQ